MTLLRSLAGRGVWRAAIVSSVLFGLLHTVNVLAGADPAASMVQVGYAAPMGFGFAAVTLRTGAIWPLVIIHALIDLTGFLTTDGTVSTGLTSADGIVAAVYAVGFTVYGVVVIRSFLRRRADQDDDDSGPPTMVGGPLVPG